MNNPSLVPKYQLSLLSSTIVETLSLKFLFPLILYKNLKSLSKINNPCPKVPTKYSPSLF